MKCKSIYVVSSDSYYNHVAEEINNSAESAGYASAINEDEFYACIKFIERQINECDEFIAAKLSYVVEEVELDD